MGDIGRLLVMLGVVLAIVGAIVLALDRLGVRRLPGDVVHRGDHVTVLAPFGWMFLLSIVATIVLNLLLRR